MTRRPDWKKHLRRYLASVAHRPFAWGRHDCALFAAGAVEAVTGIDPAAAYRDRYTTQIGAARVLRREGHETPEDLLRALLPMRTGLPRPGDVAVVPADPWPALGVVQGQGVYVLAENGLRVLPLSAALRLYAVD